MPSPLAVLPSSSPIPIAVFTLGTVILVLKVALSEGWLFEGNQPWAPIGSLTTRLPSHVSDVAAPRQARTQPSREPSGSTISTGVPL